LASHGQRENIDVKKLGCKKFLFQFHESNTSTTTTRVVQQEQDKIIVAKVG